MHTAMPHSPYGQFLQLIQQLSAKVVESGDGLPPEDYFRSLFALLSPQLLNLWVWETRGQT